MDQSGTSNYATTTDREGDLELVVTRTFNGPARHVFAAWTKPELMMRWWVPKSFGITLLSVVTDVRVGGSYRLEFGVPGSDQPVAFFGRYLEVEPPTRLVWTNEESDEGSVTTMTLDEKDGRTHLVLRDRYPSKAALDEAIASGSTGAHAEQFAQLDGILSAQPAG
jgi:uncharacterized protein YndB with AHSA1/START domain